MGTVTNRAARSSTQRQLRAAAVIQLVQGVLMEGIPFLALPVFLAFGLDSSLMAHGFSFVVPFFDENLFLMMAMSGTFASLRIIGSIGLLRGRMWGYVLSLVNCTVTLILMVFMLPAGIADGILSGSALLLLLMGYYGKSPIANKSV